MAEAFATYERDQRTFGAQQARLLDDLNRPDLEANVVTYLQDAMRYFQRKPFFFSETDNTSVPHWRPRTMYPQGACIQQVADENRLNYVYCALSSGIQQSGVVPPERWPSTIFTTPPGSGVFPPPPVNFELGVLRDGDVIWANIGLFQPMLFTNLSTVYNVNQVIPPIDWIAPYQIQITTANLRLLLEKISFDQLSQYDVVRPAPISAYPRMWAFWQGQIYLWVYPNGFYPITLNYYTGPAVATEANESNFWTTQGERLIRKYAQAAISREVLYDQDAAQQAMAAVGEELSQLKAQVVSQQGYAIPAGDW